jgi:hypothetical protein
MSLDKKIRDEQVEGLYYKYFTEDGGQYITIPTKFEDEWYVGVYDAFTGMELKDPKARLLRFYNVTASEASDEAVKLVT